MIQYLENNPTKALLLLWVFLGVLGAMGKGLAPKYPKFAGFLRTCAGLGFDFITFAKGANQASGGAELPRSPVEKEEERGSIPTEIAFVVAGAAGAILLVGSAASCGGNTPATMYLAETQGCVASSKTREEADACQRAAAARYGWEAGIPPRDAATSSDAGTDANP